MLPIQTKEHYEQVLKESGSKLVVIDFFADWCGPCKMIAPKLEEMEKEFPDVVFIKVNVDDNEEVAQDCGISAMPTFHFVKNCEKVDEIVGANETRIRECIKKNK